MILVGASPLSELAWADTFAIRRTIDSRRMTTHHPAPGAATAPGRLLALVFALGAMFLSTGSAAGQEGPRCAWSPDGRHVVYVSVRNQNWFVACYEMATGKHERLLTAPTRNRIHAVTWSPDGKQVVAISHDSSHPRSISAHHLTFPRQGPAKTDKRELAHVRDDGALVHDGTGLWLLHNELIRWRGDSVRTVKTRKEEVVTPLGPVANGIAYYSLQTTERPFPWELGTLDLQTLERTVRYTQEHPAFAGYLVDDRVAFAPDGRRVAVTAYDPNAEQYELLIVDGDEVLSKLPIGNTATARSHDLAWSRDGARVFAYVYRTQPNRDVQHTLMEAAFSGSATRETPLFTQASNMDVRESHGLAISPDGRTAALQVRPGAKGPPQLCLVDLTGRERKVTMLDPLPGIQILVQGSDWPLTVAQAWQGAYHDADQDHRILLRGGGSAEGMKSLINGKADLAVLVRRPSPTELAIAKTAKVDVEARCFVREAVAVCVHPDNPLEEIGPILLRRVFTASKAPNWAQFAVDLPEGHQEIAPAMVVSHNPDYIPVRMKVLNNQRAADRIRRFEKTTAVAEFVQQNPGAIACLPVELARSLGDRVRIVSIASKGDAIAPNDEAIVGGTYPLTLNWFLVHRKDCGPNVRAFLQWTGTDAARDAAASVGRRMVR